VPRPDTPARIGQAKIKKVAWQPARQISELDPTDQSAAGPAHHRGKTPAENDGDVADLVWKYFAEEITEPNTRFKKTGPTEHRRRLAEVARRYGWSDSRIEIIDDDLGRPRSSAETLSGWQPLQDMIDANRVGTVFVSSLDPLSRDLLELEVFDSGRARKEARWLAACPWAGNCQCGSLDKISVSE
jgi:hypothetical protein